LNSKIQSLETEIKVMKQQHELDVAPVIEANTPKEEEEPDIRQEPDLEIVPTNQQDDVNKENCSKVTNKNTKWWPWSKQKQSGKSSDDECVVLSMLEVIECKIAIFEPKLSSMQSLHQEMDRQVAEINQKISKMEMADRIINLENANTLLATGDANLNDRLDQVGQCNNDLTPRNNDVTEDVFDNSHNIASITEKIAVIQHYLKRRRANQNKARKIEKKKESAREKKLRKKVDANTYMLHSVIKAIQLTQYYPAYPDHWEEAREVFADTKM